MAAIPSQQILDSLNWRYATKVFDPAKKISSADWNALEESLILTPSSFGLQPWEFVLVENPSIREQLVKFSWNQRQVADASHLLVIAIRTDIDAKWVDHFVSRVEEIRGDQGAFTGYRDMMAGFVSNLDEDGVKQWAKLQTYIALGQFMTCAALMEIDACPMEGFVADQYDEILGFKDKNLTTAVLCPAGYRSDEDKYAHLPKVRFPKDQMISRI
ncbi:NAD(P)H-dependent oxidoreductase [Verrucomicrobiales bacterium]|mgnify:CR=1 FL=1|nr:NAD(P)H-dependent oxidoreductase [Verrucomicrobiales bacterium]|tara:strand:+ start:340 stop:984 length:645 start_codon:yes stop_codon:yes gene_type:complete